MSFVAGDFPEPIGGLQVFARNQFSQNVAVDRFAVLRQVLRNRVLVRLPDAFMDGKRIEYGLFAGRDFEFHSFDFHRFGMFGENRKRVRPSGFRSGLRSFENHLRILRNGENPSKIFCIYYERIWNRQITHPDFEGFRSSYDVMRPTIFSDELFYDLPIRVFYGSDRILSTAPGRISGKQVEPVSNGYDHAHRLEPVG